MGMGRGRSVMHEPSGGLWVILTAPGNPRAKHGGDNGTVAKPPSRNFVRGLHVANGHPKLRCGDAPLQPGASPEGTVCPLTLIACLKRVACLESPESS